MAALVTIATNSLQSASDPSKIPNVLRVLRNHFINRCRKIFEQHQCFYFFQVNDEPIAQPACDAGHDRYKLYPIVLPTWQHSQLKSCPERSVIIPE